MAILDLGPIGHLPLADYTDSCQFPTRTAFALKAFMAELHVTPVAHTANAQREPPDFSLVLGETLFQLGCWTRLSGDTLDLLHRRICFSFLFPWLALLLSVLEEELPSGSAAAPFLRDVEGHVKLLLAMPVDPGGTRGTP